MVAGGGGDLPEGSVALVQDTTVEVVRGPYRYTVSHSYTVSHRGLSCRFKAPQHRKTQPALPQGKRPSRTPTYDESDLTGGLLISTGHHGAHRVVDYGHHVQIEFLWGKKDKL